MRDLWSDMHIALALGMVVVAITLLSIDRIPIEISSLTIVVLLALLELVTPQEALAGFSSETAIFIFALLAMTQGLAATGVMSLVGRRLVSLARISTRTFVLVLLYVVGAFSSVASNTAVTAAFLPVVTASAAHIRMSPRMLLLPMAFTSMLGGTVFLFGTSTNLVVSGALESFGMPRIGFAELTPLGLPLLVGGVLLTYVLARRLLPARGDEDSDLANQREYMTELVILPGSRMIGRGLHEVANELALPVHAVVRDKVTLPTEPEVIMQEHDELVVSGTLEQILRVKDLRSVKLLADLRLIEHHGEAATLVEISIPPTSVLDGRSLRDVRFADRYGLVVVAIHRHPSLQRLEPELDLLDSLTAGEQLKTLRLSVGDMLLLRGPERRVRELAGDEEITVLSGVEYERPRYDHAIVAVAIFVVTVIVAGTRLTSPAIAGLAGVLAMVATGCVSARSAFRVDWRVIIMIGALLTLGLAMERSGAGELIARVAAPLGTSIGPRGMLFVQMLLTVALSIPMSNQAAALIMLPIGIHLAVDIGLNPRTFAIATCLAASCSFVTPFEPAAALVYGPGRYRLIDFLRLGGPLNLVALGILVIGVPLVWPFAP